MMATLIKTLLSDNGLMKVELFRRQDGTFGFQEWHFHSQENAWALFGRRPTSICDSLEKAEAEARGRVEWLSSGEQADA